MSQPVAESQTPTAAKPSRLEFIDALRGFACLWVLLCHVEGFWLPFVPLSAWGPLRLLEKAVEGFCKVGVAGVDLFIVLSGFCLYWPVVRAWRKGSEFQPPLFFKRRAKRIVPAYYAAVLLCTAITLYRPLQKHYGPHPPSIADVLGYLGFVMTFFPRSVLTSVNGTYWSIALEVQLYLCFPAAVWVARRFGLAAVVVGAVAITGGWQLVQWKGPYLNPVAFVYHLPARYLEFVMGMVAAAAAAAPRRGQGRVGLAASAVALPVALLCAKYHINDLSEIMFTAWGVVFAGLILFLAELPAEWFADLRRAGLLTRVGIVSYSLYLLHAPVMLLSTEAAVSLARRTHAGPLAVIGLFCVLGVPVLTAMGYGFYLLFEKPFMNPARRPGPLLSADPDRPSPEIRMTKFE